MATPTKQTAKQQGFPAVYLGPTGNFKPGLDARAKSDLIAAVLKLDNPDALYRFRADKAQKLIKARGWQSHVDRKRKLLASWGT
jgi:hypothetical protein